MSMYQDIYCDLPSRVYEVWQRTKEETQNNQRDLSVTAMLMAAATGFAMPWEDIHITKNRPARHCHVARDPADQGTYATALKNFNEFFNQPLINSTQFKGVEFAKCNNNLSEVRNVGEYGGGMPIELANKKVGFAFSILRNALAHNNIVAFGSDVQKIEKLTFFSEILEGSSSKKHRAGWNVLTIPTKLFEKLLTDWFSLVSASGTYAAAVDALAAQDAASEA